MWGVHCGRAEERERVGDCSSKLPSQTSIILALSLSRLSKTVINGVTRSSLPPTPGLDLVHANHLLIDLADEAGADLLGQLPGITAWVRGARSSSPTTRVLVHCAAGVSRSASVVAACLLAEGAHSTAGDALAAVAAAHPRSDPNPGFASQLTLFEASLRAAATTPAAAACGPPACRAWAAARLGEAVEARDGPGADLASLLAALPSLAPPPRAVPACEAAAAAAAGGAPPPPPPPPPTTLYRCRACRRLVASADNAVPLPDPPPAGGHTFRGKSGAQRRGGGGGGAFGGGPAASPSTHHPLGVDGSSLFVQPLRWMFEGLGGDGSDATAPLPLAGKLSCPGCGARLGSFNWSGGQSAAGAWVVPAFQLHLGRLDAMRGGVGGVAGGGAVGAVSTPARLL